MSYYVELSYESHISKLKSVKLWLVYHWVISRTFWYPSYTLLTKHYLHKVSMIRNVWFVTSKNSKNDMHYVPSLIDISSLWLQTVMVSLRKWVHCTYICKSLCFVCTYKVRSDILVRQYLYGSGILPELHRNSRHALCVHCFQV